MADTRADLIALSDYVYERTRNRLDGLTDTEYFWEPVPSCWTIRRVGSDKYQADHSDSPDIPPFTTIACRGLGSTSGRRTCIWQAQAAA